MSSDTAPCQCVGVDDVDFVEPVGQIRRVAHVVDRLPDGPVRRHRDEFGLHPPAGGVFRIEQAALDLSRSDGGSFSRICSWSSSSRPSSIRRHRRIPVRGRLLRRLGSSSSRISSRTASSTSFSAEKSKSVPVSSTRLTRSRFKRRDQIAEIGLMQFRDDVAEQRPVDRVDRLRNLLDEFGGSALLVAHRQAVEH